MDILFVVADYEKEQYSFIPVMQREFGRRGLETEIMLPAGNFKSLRKVWRKSRNCRLAVLNADAMQGHRTWLRKLILHILSRHARQVAVIIDREENSREGTKPWFCSGSRNVRYFTHNADEACRKSDGKSMAAEYLPLPVDMAAHNFRYPDLRKTDGRLVVLVTDPDLKEAARKQASQIGDIAIVNGCGCSRQRLEELYAGAHVLLCGHQPGSPSSLSLRGMADGKVAVGTGGGEYQNKTGEPLSIFYPDIENPTPDDGIFGVPVPLGWGEYGIDLNFGNENMSVVEKELNRVFCYLSEPAILRQLSEAGRSHVRSYHDSAKVADLLLGRNSKSLTGSGAPVRLCWGCKYGI